MTAALAAFGSSRCDLSVDAGLLPPAVGPPKRPLHETFLLWLPLGDSMTLGCGTDATKTDRAATCAQDAAGHRVPLAWALS